MNEDKTAPDCRVPTGSGHRQAVDIQTVRSRLLDKGLVYFAAIMPLALAVSLARIFEHGWHPIHLLHITVFVLFATVTFFRKRFPYHVRACLLLGTLLLLAMASFPAFGLVGGGFLVLFAFSVLTALAFGTRMGLAACALSLVIVTVSGAAVGTGVLTFSFSISEYATSVSVWCLMTMAFLMAAPVSVIALGTVYEHLEASLRDLQDSYAQHERLVNNLVDSFLYRHDLGGDFKYVSSSVTQVLGHSTEAFLSHWTEYLTDHPVNQEALRCSRRSANGIQQPPYAVEMYHKDGSARWLEVSETPVRDRSGNTIAVEGVAHDITDHKRAKEALQKERDFSDTLVRTSPAFFVALDGDGRTRVMNEAMLAALGYRAEEVHGKDYLRTFTPEADWDALCQTFIRLTETGELGVSEDKVLTKDGGQLVVEWRARPIFDRDGNMDLFIGVGIDITERRRAAREREKLEDQLRQSQKMEAVGQLAGGVAHDFNNLLQVILGFGELALAQSGADSELRRELGHVMNAASRAKTLVRQLLAFSREQVLELTDVPLGEVVGEMTRMLQRVIGEHITYNVHCEPGLKPIRADRGQIEQVLVNLFLNARDALAQGGTLSIKTDNIVLDAASCESHAWAKPGDYVLLSVSDTGCGMDEETQQRIFEPFFTTKELGEGTGLGLSTVFGIVRQHDGMINVQSELAAGTTVKVYLPVSEAVKTVDTTKETLPPKGGTETILLADDDEGVREVAEVLLQKSGYTVLLAADGEEAMRVFDEYAGEVHLALLDVVMPKLGGRAVFDHIQKKSPQIPVLFVSGYNTEVIHSDFAPIAGSQLVQKPYQGNVLLRKVRDVLDAR